MGKKSKSREDEEERGGSRSGLCFVPLHAVHKRMPPVFLPEGLGSLLILSPQHTDTGDKGGTVACHINTCLFRDEIAVIDLV